MSERNKDTDRPAILCVDDEPNVVEGLSLHLERSYRVRTATSGAAGLAALESEGPFAVVISDLRMPQMDGIAFLTQVKARFPDTARILLTGQVDVENAIAAVNEGEIFRFLTKPCPPETLLKVSEAAVRQYQLTTSERELLQGTLKGSIKALLEVLSLSNPVAFGRAQRIRRQAADLARHVGIQDLWQIEVAAMLSQIGAVVLPDEVASKLYQGLALSNEERELVEKMPTIAEQLVAHIPRLDAIRAILRTIASPFEARTGGRTGAAIPIGARILRIAIDWDVLESQGVAEGLAIDTMRGRTGIYDSRLLEEFAVLKGRPTKMAEIREIASQDLKIGMILAEDIKTRDGTVLVARGQEVTHGVVLRVRNRPPGYLKEPFMVVLQFTAEATAALG